MARIVRDARLDSRAARAKLPVQAKPFWRTINEGAHLGYYRGQRGGRWLARFRKAGSAGGYVQETLGEADDASDADGERILDYRQAQEAARAWFDKTARGDARRGPYTVADALDDYMAGRSERSVAKTRARVDKIIRPALGAIDLAELTAKQVQDWHRARGASPAALRTSRFAKEANQRAADTDEAIRRRQSTANRDLTVLKAALNAAFKAERVASSAAWTKVTPFRNVDQAKLRYLSEEEARRLVNAMDPAFRPLVQAALLTGGRYGELTAVRVSDVELTPGRANVRFSETKSGKVRWLALGPEGVRLFTQLTAGQKADAFVFRRADGKRWGADQQARHMVRACDAGKVTPAATFHDLRRTFGARMAIKGVPMAYIAEALGHADERITRKHYAHLAPSHVADTIRAAIEGLGVVEQGNVRRLG